jgi:putative oxidoreductase
MRILSFCFLYSAQKLLLI